MNNYGDLLYSIVFIANNIIIIFLKLLRGQMYVKYSYHKNNNTNKRGSRKLWKVIYTFMTLRLVGNVFMGVYRSPNSSNCIYEICTAFKTIKKEKLK